jgi:hypothetical protein
MKAKKSGKARSSRKRTTKDLPTRADQLKLQGATNSFG